MKKAFLFAVAMFGMALSASAALPPSRLLCDYQDGKGGEIVIGAEAPRLSWQNSTGQSAYRLMVATSAEKLAKGRPDLWDSGKVDSSESHLVEYSGPRMAPMTEYWWTVMVWDEDGNPSPFSEPARWTTGMLDSSDWKAEWIQAPWMEDVWGNWYTGAPMFRKDFKVKKGLVSAKAFISGLGWFEMHLNGQKVGDDYFVPGFTDYTRRPHLGENPRVAISPDVEAYRTLYLCYDITSQLRKGDNAVGVLLGNGYFHSDPDNENRNESYGVPRLICQIVLTYKDGHRELVCSDTSWQAAPSPIAFQDLYKGEVYDASMEVQGWDMPQKKGLPWENAVPATAPDGPLTANMGPTDKVMETLEPVSFEKTGEGSYRVKFSKEVTGWIKFKDISGEAGKTLKVQYMPVYVTGRCEYKFKDANPVTWAPRFTWYVFSEAEITGVNSLDASQVVAEVVNSNVRENSIFECSNPLFMRINQIYNQSLVDNMHSGVATDCPHRERAPYTGDGQLSMSTAICNVDAASFYNKWITDIRNSRNPQTGHVPNGSPWEPICGGGPAWGAAICVMPTEFYLRYGDRRMLSDNLEAMKGFTNFFAKWMRPDGTCLVAMAKPGSNEPFRWLNLGEWAPAYDLPDDALVHTFLWWLCAQYTSEAAGILGDKETALEYSVIADNVKEAFNNVFYDAAAKTYGDYGSNVFALRMGVPQDRLQDVRATLRNELEVKYNKHLNTGLIGTRYLFEVLSENGMGDLAYAIMNQRDFPSYGWWIEQGATVTWEQWNGNDSHNHPMFGGGLGWFSKCLAGVRPDPAEPGFRHIIIKPIPVPEVNSVTYATETPYGELKVKVTHNGRRVHIDADIPAGAHATVYVPRSVELASKEPQSEGSYAVYETGAGHCSF